MIIWPQTISRSDEGWNTARALMKVLPLDLRRLHYRLPADAPQFYGTAQDLLIRPMITVDRRQVLAPYFSYTIDFSVSCRALGNIPVNDEAQLEEFLSVVNEAFVSELTIAEKGLWEVSRLRNQLERRLAGARLEDRDALSCEIEPLKVRARELSWESNQFYNAKVDSILTSWRADGAQGRQPGHFEVIQALLAQGKEILAQQDDESEASTRRARESMAG